MFKLEVWSEYGPLLFWIDAVEEITGNESEITVTIRKQETENSISKLFKLMMTDDTHNNGIDICIVGEGKEFSYYGYNMLAFAGDRTKFNDEELDIRITFRNESANKKENRK